MGPGKIDQVKEIIARETANAGAETGLKYWLLERVVNLHRLIDLPKGQEYDTLADFLERYVDFLPVCLEQFHAICQQANITEYSDLFLDLAVEFLLSPPQDVEYEPGIGHLIDEVYMAHRMLEELNDRCYGYLGGPAMPADTSSANIIVHSLIGDDFANELDIAVQYAIEANREREQAVMSRLNPASVSSLGLSGKDWPMFAEDTLVRINFLF